MDTRKPICCYVIASWDPVKDRMGAALLKNIEWMKEENPHNSLQGSETYLRGRSPSDKVSFCWCIILAVSTAPAKDGVILW